MKLISLVRIGVFISVIWFMYWIFIFEIFQLGKPFVDAMAANPFNVVMLFVSIGLFVALSWKKTKPFFENILDLNLPLFDSTPSPEETTEIPKSWLQGRNDVVPVTKEVKKSSREVLSIETREQETVRLLTGEPRGFRIPGLLKIKQFVAAILLLFDIAMSYAVFISEAQNRFMFFFFILQGWICLEYLWKTRRLAREREKARRALLEKS